MTTPPIAPTPCANVVPDAPIKTDNTTRPFNRMRVCIALSFYGGRPIGFSGEGGNVTARRVEGLSRLDGIFGVDRQ
jgi:hypothetical protein